MSVAIQALLVDATLTFAVAQRDYTAAIATILTKFESFKHPNVNIRPRCWNSPLSKIFNTSLFLLYWCNFTLKYWSST